MSTKQQVRLLESVADIAYEAGRRKYYSGDSREDINQFIEWAEEFEKARTVEHGDEMYFGQDYMTAIEVFCTQKLGDVWELPAPIKLRGSGAAFLKGSRSA